MPNVHIFITDKSRNAKKAQACDEVTNMIDPTLGLAISKMLADGFELSDILEQLHKASTVVAGFGGILREKSGPFRMVRR